MANHKSALKRARQNENRRARNRGARSNMRTVLNDFDAAVATSPEAGAAALNATVSQLAIAAKKGLIPRARASRKIGRLSKQIAKLS